jgi:hypothetical protein
MQVTRGWSPRVCALRIFLHPQIHVVKNSSILCNFILREFALPIYLLNTIWEEKRDSEDDPFQKERLLINSTVLVIKLLLKGQWRLSFCAMLVSSSLSGSENLRFDFARTPPAPGSSTQVARNLALAWVRGGEKHLNKETPPTPR